MRVFYFHFFDKPVLDLVVLLSILIDRSRVCAILVPTSTNSFIDLNQDLLRPGPPEDQRASIRF